ncbi:unnamed protein product [Cylindrotheca closterium]|uniref:Choline transporter-like protein n=1 Tax=Cylindrotheca closterium TaxID=2856 RepID=A0AAD2G5H4_9STRA|nr:unnamed protein product [Cylindrotheca closterium]
MSCHPNEKDIDNDEPQMVPVTYATVSSAHDPQEFSEAQTIVVGIEEASSGLLQHPQPRQHAPLPHGRQSSPPNTDASIHPASIQVVTFDEQPTNGDDVTGGMEHDVSGLGDNSVRQESTPLLHQNGGAVDLNINALTTENHPYANDFFDDDITSDGRAKCHDLTWAVLFWAHIATVVYAGTQLAPQGYSMMQKNDFDLQQLHDFMQDNFITDDFTAKDLDQLTHFLYELQVWWGIYPIRILWFGIAVAVVSFGLNMFKIYFIIRAHTPFFVAASLIIPGGIFGCLLILMMSDQGLFGFLFCVTVLGFLALYIRKLLWPKLHFAALNLEIALTGIGSNMGTYVWTFAMVEITVLWIVFWCYTVLGMIQYIQRTQCPDIKFDPQSDNNDTCGPSTAVLVALLFSLFWTLKCVGNTVQVYVSGVMATWCFDKETAQGFCSSAVTSSMYRSISFSSGPIAFGSLFQGACKVLRWILGHSNRNLQDANDDCRCCCFCICDLILECLSELFGDVLEYFNQWAYCFVGINGTSYLESGKAAANLFKQRGWTALITDRLVALVLGFGILEGGVVTGLVAIAMERLVTWSTYRDDHADLPESYVLGPLCNVPMATFLFGFVIGCIVSGVMMNVIHGAVNTLIICWAKSPETFTDNHKHWADRMTTVWSSAFPGSQNRDGGRVTDLSDYTTSEETSSFRGYGAIGTSIS